MGRPRSTHDIDIFVRPEDAESALEALGQNGFETERTDARWLFKGWKEEMMVDVIFKSQGDIYFDTEMHQRAKLISYHGRNIPAVAPEDLVIIKAAVHSEVGPHHWHDALAILSHAQVDWLYLLKRARRAPRRLLALLIYAQSNDIWIPNQIIIDLYDIIFAQNHHQMSSSARAQPMVPSVERTSKPPEPARTNIKTSIDAYLIGHLMEHLATDARTAAADIQVTVGNRKILVKGDSPTRAHRQAIEDVIRDHIDDYEVDNQVRVTEIAAPDVEQVI